MIKRTILIVDDQEINRRILKKLLESEYVILEAADGREALGLMRQNAEVISAIMLDIVMPVMSGYEVLEAMMSDAVLSKIPVIVSSQKDGDEAEIKALSLGAQDFIAKPYKSEIIKRRLSNTIKLRETASLINKVERDELTGLYNKQFFIEKVYEQLHGSSDKKYDIISFGIERFKLINETYGLSKGDELLCFIADQLKTEKRPVLSARFNADHFFLLAEHRDFYKPEYFTVHIDKVNNFLTDMNVNINCGIYTIDNIDTPVSVMCDRAQLAAEKNKGIYDTPYSMYDDSIRRRLHDEQFIIGNMKTALESNQFQVYYQPKYDLNNELVAGAEALVRWIHPERGIISPGAFIPLFEKNGFITQLDRYVWETACRDIRSWMDKGYSKISVSVNVSRADIYNPHLTDILLELIAKYEIPIRYLHLEITESAYTDNPDQIIVAVNKLRNLGFIIEMDDFGSGYSSLNMLAEMPVDVLKLDMHFIQSETSRTSGKGILSFVISLAKWLNLAVVAEGVETAEQISTLRSMECNYVQGFYFAKPMKQSDFDTLLKTSKTTEMICSSQTIRQYVSKDSGKKSSGKMREMLIVDDIELNRIILSEAFGDEYTTIECENGSVALEYLKENYSKVEIVLLDLLMPVMDGYQLLDKIRSDPNMKDMPVIITSQGDSESEHRALQMQADDFISKPYNPDIIRHRVHNVLASHQLVRMKSENRKNKQQETFSMSDSEKAFSLVEALKPHFDIVRLVEPDHTLVCRDDVPSGCEIHACFAVWGKATRCSNCISLRALHEKNRCCKLEYSKSGLYFVISEYVPFGEPGAVIEMVTKLDDAYIDNIFDKKLLYARLDVIHQQLEIDELTEVYNRRYIDCHIDDITEKAHIECRSIGIAMIDIDKFKQMNDSYGHLAGDKVLKSVARLLSDNITIRKGDFVARFGGDEFLVVCLNVDSAVMLKRIEAVTELIKKIELDEIKGIGVSAGCVASDEFPEAKAFELIDIADKRLYKAKKSGRGCVVGE